MGSVDTGHSPIGASTCERWMACPGSVAAIAALPVQPDTFYSAEGTVAHLIAAKELTRRIEQARAGELASFGFITAYLYDEIGRTYVEGDFEIEVTEDMVDAVQVYVDHVDSLMTEWGLSYASNIEVEVRFALPHLDDQAYGTGDCALYIPMVGIIILDYKHGQGYAVDATWNKQLLYYALGAYYTLTEPDREHLSFVRAAIVQPRAKHAAGPIRYLHVSPTDLLAHQDDLYAGIRRVRSGDTTLQAGPHCKFCPAKPVCAEFRASLQRSAGLDFGPLETTSVALPPAGSFTPEGLANLVSNAADIRAWASSVLDFASAYANAGNEIPGYKLVEKTGNRRWLSEDAVEKAYLLEFGDEIYNKKIKSPAQMEKVLKTKRKDELKSYYEIPITGKTLVKESDLRQTAEPTKRFDEFLGEALR